MTVEEQAVSLARENFEADTDISAVYWIPNQDEVRLIEVQKSIPLTPDEEVHPFYFRAAPEKGLQFPMAIALIRPEEFGNLKLPSSWGDWKNAQKLENSR